MQEVKSRNRQNNNLILVFWWKFFPYWPLFLLLTITFGTLAWAYIKHAVPIYKANASIIVKDENKGVDDSKMTESLNPFATKKTVENEIEVIKSRSLMNEVVKSLNLVAPIYEEKKSKAVSAYSTSPIKIKVANLDSFSVTSKVYFTYNIATKKVIINKETFPTNQWVMTKFGKLRFDINNNSTVSERSLYFSLLNPGIVCNDYISRLGVIPTSKLSTVLSLTLTDEVPKRAEDVLNELIKAYDKASVKEKNFLATNTLSFVEDRLAIVSGELDSIERKIQKYKSQQGAIDLSNQGKLFLENVSSNDQKLSDVNMKLSVLKQVERYLVSKDQQGGIVPSTLGVEDPLLTNLLNKLYENELEYDKLKKTYAENHPLLLSVQEQINKIKPSILENIQSQRRSLEASRANLYTTNSSYTSQLQTMPEKERELLEISREQAIKSNIYNFLLQKREEAALSNSSSIANTKLLDQAQAGLFPTWPNKSIIYPTAIILAFITGFAIVVLLDLLNRKVSSREDLELLTSMPIIGELIYKKVENSLAIGVRRHTFLAEQFRRLRTSLPYLGINSINKRVLITSSISGEGKSFTALNLALSLALAGKKVVLLELDLINPSLSKSLVIENHVGITAYLKGEAEAAEVIAPTQQNENLFFIPAGELTDNPSELLMNDKMAALLSLLNEQFDAILIDTAPVGLISDAYYLSPFCDVTLFIVRHNYTPKVLIERLDEENHIYEIKNGVIVFNGVDGKGITKRYSYGNDYLEKEQRKLTQKRFYSNR